MEGTTASRPVTSDGQDSWNEGVWGRMRTKSQWRRLKACCQDQGHWVAVAVEACLAAVDRYLGEPIPTSSTPFGNLQHWCGPSLPHLPHSPGAFEQCGPSAALQNACRPARLVTEKSLPLLVLIASMH